MHGSQPRFIIPEITQDMHRAVRFVRSRADQYKFDPQRIGITGASAGGHLSLMLGTTGTAGNSEAKDAPPEFIKPGATVVDVVMTASR